MKTISIRDLRERWPEVEAALKIEQEILITRKAKPVAKLVWMVPEIAKGKRWDPEEHKKWIKKVFGNKIFPSSDEQMAEARADRWEKKSEIRRSSPSSKMIPAKKRHPGNFTTPR